MERHDSYKDSGVDWLEEIPAHWNVMPLRAATRLKADRDRPDLQVLSVYRDYGVIPKDSRDDNHNATSLDTNSYKVVKPGDLVVNKMKAWQGSMGVSRHEGIVSPAYITCATNPDIIKPNFLHYLVRSALLIDVYGSLSYGVRVGQWDMHYEDLKQIRLPIPEPSEQDRIVAFLDQKTAEIDTAIAKKERLIELLQEQKSILINQAVTRGLNPDVPLRDSGVEWIGQIPTHWDVRKVAHLFRLIGSGTTPPSGDLRYYEDGSIDWVNTGDLTDWDIVAETKKLTPLAIRRYSTLKIYPKGTLIVAMYGATIGKTGISTTPAAVNQACCCLNGSDAITSRYAQLWFFGYKREIVSMGYGGGQPNISQEVIRSLRIPVPPIDEQTEIVSHIEAAMTKIDRVAEMTIATLSQLNEIKSSLIASAVTGKIKV